MKLNTYLTFDGQARDAMNYYQEVLGGEMTVMTTFGDGPMDVPEEQKDKIMHAHLSIPTGAELMASDGGGVHPVTAGNNFHLSIYMETSAEGGALLDKLSEGGSVTMKFGEVFWGGHFGSCTDRFGINWMVSTP